MATLDLLIQTPALLYTSLALFALVIGSFLNVVIHRLPLMMEAEWRRECAQLIPAEAETKLETKAGAGTEAETEDKARPYIEVRAVDTDEAGSNEEAASVPPPPAAQTLAWPGSHCPRCGHRIRPLENIPLLSYLFLGGRCSACHQPIGWRYPLVEALTATLSVLVVWRLGVSWETGGALLLTWGLIALTFIDIDTQLLPDNLTFPLLWLGLLMSLGGRFATPPEAILGAALGYLFLWTVYQIFKLVTGREGMGYGDFKLFALFGAWLGWQALPLILILSSLVGAVFGMIHLARSGQDRHTPLPFGPYLAAAGWITLLWGEGLSGTYLYWSGLG